MCGGAWQYIGFALKSVMYSQLKERQIVTSVAIILITKQATLIL